MGKKEIIEFISEITNQFTQDNLPYLMKNRRVYECKLLANKYVNDPRFTTVAEYAIKEGGIDMVIEEFKTDSLMNLMNIIMFFYCFKSSYNGVEFNELYILNQKSFEELVFKLSKSNSLVEIETGILLGGICISGDYHYKKGPYHIVGSSMEVLIKCANPD